MACKSCGDKKSKPQLNTPSDAQTISCSGCGVTRILPSGLQKGDLVHLPSCPRCGVGFKGRFMGNTVEELN